MGRTHAGMAGDRSQGRKACLFGRLSPNETDTGANWNEPPGVPKKVEVEFVRPFGSLLRAKVLREEEGGLEGGERKGLPPKVEGSPVLSG